MILRLAPIPGALLAPPVVDWKGCRDHAAIVTARPLILIGGKSAIFTASAGGLVIGGRR